MMRFAKWRVGNPFGYSLGTILYHLRFWRGSSLSGFNGFEKKKLPMQFVIFSLAGALVEYFGSLFQEIAFGSTSWDYSSHSLNIGGRVSLQMTLILGILGITFVRFVFPSLVRLLGKMERGFWRIGCVALSVFMAVNLLLSAAAVMRWKDRPTGGTPASNAFEQFLDETYDNDAMEKNYPNMKFSG